jgi:hypothetical protein
VEYIVVGGAAARGHGSAHFTQDLDVVYSRSAANLDRLVSAVELRFFACVSKSLCLDQ